MSEYFDLDRTKRLINAQSSVDDTLIRELGASASIDMRNYLASLTENLPAGDDITDDIYNAVSYSVVSRYLGSVSDWEGMRMWKAEAADARENVRIGIQKNVRSNIIKMRAFGRGDI